jgi:hypothetical protein
MKKVLGTLVVVGVAALSHAGVGTNGAVTLLQAIGGRASGMGEAYAAAGAGDVFGIHYNPAVSVADKQLGALYQRGIADDNFGGVAFAMPIAAGRVAASVIYYSVGQIEMWTNEATPRLITKNGLTDIIAVLSYAKDLDKLSVGGNLKIYNSTLVEEFSTMAFMVDVGGGYAVNENVKVGVAVQNLGTSVKYGETADSLPLVIRGGAAYVKEMGSNKLTVAADVAKFGDDSTIKILVGGEYLINNMLAVRAGYKVGFDTESFTVGAGFMQQKFSVDYAFVPFGDLGTSHRLSFGLKL